MIPAVRAGGTVRPSIEAKLKPQWHWEPSRRVFLSRSGEEFHPGARVPRTTRIVYKVPGLAEGSGAGLSKHERELRRYVQVILPLGESPASFVGDVRAWPPVAEAQVAPEISLPSGP